MLEIRRKDTGYGCLVVVFIHPRRSLVLFYLFQASFLVFFLFPVMWCVWLSAIDYVALSFIHLNIMFLIFEVLAKALKKEPFPT